MKSSGQPQPATVKNHNDIIANKEAMGAFIIKQSFGSRCVPVELSIAQNGKKIAKFDDGWTTNIYEEYDTKNSIAIRTGNGITVLDYDTKEINLLEPWSRDFLADRLKKKDCAIIETTKGYHVYLNTGDFKFKNDVKISDFLDIRSEGGCVFVHSDVKGLSYSVICDEKPFTPDEKLLSQLNVLDAKGTGFNYTDDGKKVALVSRTPNPALFNAVASGDIKRIILATGMKISNFNEGQMYTSFNKFAFILCNEPSIHNEDVEAILKLLVEEVFGFEWNSDTTQKMVQQSLGNMIWVSEYKEPSNEGDFEILQASNSLDILAKFRDGAMSDSKRKELQNMKFVIPGLLPERHHVFLYGASGAGKTTIAHVIAKEAAKNGKDVYFLYMDGSPDIAVKMYEDIEKDDLQDRYHLVYELSAAEILTMLKKMAHDKTDLSNILFIIDTFKFITTNVNDKGANKTALHLIKELCRVGATALTLGHTNKDGKRESGTAEIEQDSDDLLRMDSEANPDGRIFSSISKGGRVRMNFVPRTYSFIAGNPKSCILEHDFEALDDSAKKERDKERIEKQAIENVEKYLKRGKCLKKDVLLFVEDVIGLSKHKARKFIDNYEGNYWEKVKGDDNKQVFLQLWEL